MAYRIAGLAPDPFTPLFAPDDAAPAAPAMPGEAAAAIAALLADPALAYIDAHNAAQGCFLARVERA